MMKRVTALLLAAMMMVTVCACGNTSGTASENKKETESVQIANPWTDCTSLAEAEGIAGFPFCFGETLCEGAYQVQTYRAMEAMIDVSYSANGSDFTIRQAADNGEDQSGDYTTYTQVVDIAGENLSFTASGEENYFYLATFTYEGMYYAIYFDNGFALADIADLIGEMSGDSFEEAYSAEYEVDAE